MGFVLEFLKNLCYGGLSGGDLVGSFGKKEAMLRINDGFE
jgi:hypothetical protein